MPALAHAKLASVLGRLRKGGGHALEIEFLGSCGRGAQQDGALLVREQSCAQR